MILAFLLIVISCVLVDSARVDINSIVRWDLTAASCVSGIVDDTATLPSMGSLVLNKTDGASCVIKPGFVHPQNGVLTTGFSFGGLANIRNTIMMSFGDISSLKSQLNASQVNPLRMSLEFWFEIGGNIINGEYTLFEISQPASTGSDSVDSDGSTIALQLKYGKSPGNDLLLFTVSIGDFTSSMFASNAIFETTTNALYHLVVVLDGSTIAKIYFNQNGVNFRGTPVLSGFPDIIFSTSHWPNTHRLRLGMSASTFSPVAPIIYHSFVLHSRDLNQSDVQENFLAGPPESIPLAANSFSVVVEDTPTFPQGLISPSSFFDNRGNNSNNVSIIVKTLPAKGTLSHDNVNVAVNTLYTDLTKIRYVQLPKFKDQTTIDRNSNACTLAFDIFSYSLATPDCNPNDSSCQSGIVNGTVCVQETNDPPEIINDIIVNVKAGGSKNFDVTGFDVDSQPGKGFNNSSTLTNGKIRIVFVTSSPFGGYFRSNCITPLFPNDVLSFNSTQDLIRLCYKANFNPSNQPEIGTHSLTYRLLDSGDLESVANGTITTKIGNAVSGCEGGSVPFGLRAHCVSVGFEDSFIHVKLSGVDESNRPLTFKITSLPVNGTLCRSLDVDGNACNSALPVLNTPLPASTLFLYRPKPNYYNERNASSNLYVDQLGNGFSGCTDFIRGCPDTFNFVVIADGSVESPVAKYKIFVRDLKDNFLAENLQYPTTFEYTDQLMSFAGANSIRINDPDGDLYKIGVLIGTNDGGVSLVPPVLQNSSSLVLDGNFTLLSLLCTNPENGCTEIAFISYPSLVNHALSTLRYVPSNTNDGVQVSVFLKIYKDSQVEFGLSLGTPILSVNIKGTKKEESNTTAEGKLPTEAVIGIAVGAAALGILLGTIIGVKVTKHSTKHYKPHPPPRPPPVPSSLSPMAEELKV